MRKFLLNDKDFESCWAAVPDSNVVLELRMLSHDVYSVFEHRGDVVAENGVFTKKELEVLWKMMTKE